MKVNTEPLPYLLPASALDDTARLFVFHDSALLPASQQQFWQPAQLRQCGVTAYHCLPVAESDQGLYAALSVDAATAARLSARPNDTRALLMQEGFDAFRLIGRAQQLVHWYRGHRYCGACGKATTVRDGQGLLTCLDCAVDYYPRINPCVIVLVTRGRELLLARHRHRATHYFSCLAGFIEAGESAEEAVRREVAEEVGLQIDNLRYLHSQSWPFPSQLMLGFIAEHAGGVLQPAAAELAEARWFDVEKLPAVPSPAVSVAGQLIAAYCAQLGFAFSPNEHEV